MDLASRACSAGRMDRTTFSPRSRPPVTFTGLAENCNLSSNVQQPKIVPIVDMSAAEDICVVRFSDHVSIQVVNMPISVLCTLHTSRRLRTYHPSISSRVKASADVKRQRSCCEKPTSHWSGQPLHCQYEPIQPTCSRKSQLVFFVLDGLPQTKLKSFIRHMP